MSEIGGIDEGKLSVEIGRGARAKAVLDSDIYIEAFDSVRKAIFDKWESCPIRDKDGQHELKIMLKLLKDVDGYLRQVADTGKMASIQLEQDRTLKAKAKRFFRAA